MAVGVEVALGRRLAPQGVGLVGQADVQGVAVELGVHGHGGDAHLAAGADDPDGDLGAVGDQDLVEHAQPFGQRSGRATTLARPEGGCHVRRHRRVDALVAPGPPGTRFTVRRFAEIDSTNRYLLEQAAAGAADGAVAVAVQQAGRGRLGRRWEAPPGANLSCRCCCGPVSIPATSTCARRRWPWPPRMPARWRPGWRRTSSGPTTWWWGSASWAASWPRRARFPARGGGGGLGLNVRWPGPGRCRTAAGGDRTAGARPGASDRRGAALASLARRPAPRRPRRACSTPCWWPWSPG